MPPEITVEPARLDAPEAEGLIELAGAEMRSRYPEDSMPPADPVAAEQFVPPRGAFVLARLDGEPAGCGGVRQIEPGVGEIKRMFTLGRARRTGMARAVLAALEDQARGLGLRVLRLETGVRQPEAIALYESSGFRAIPCFGGYEGIDISRCYEKVLSPPAW